MIDLLDELTLEDLDGDQYDLAEYLGMESYIKLVRTFAGSPITDVGYQIGLQNVLTMIKNGAVPSTDDFKSIIEIYKKDCNAISLISATILSSDISSEHRGAFSSLLPIDNIEKNIDYLTRVKKHILTYMNGFDRSGIESQIDSVSRLFNDDLTLSENPWG